MKTPQRDDISSRSVLYGTEQIDIKILPKKRASRRFSLQVQPNLEVCLYTPPQASDEQINDLITKRKRWIWEKIRDFKAQYQHITPREYVSGESYFYLGRRHHLKVFENPDVSENVKLLRGRLNVTVKEKKPIRIKQILLLWYFARAQEVFARRLEAVLPSVLWVKETPKLVLRDLKRQWGHCSPHGKVTLNPQLVKASRDCIDYVILHELCHIKEHNHSPAFWELMTSVMPSWRKQRAELREMSELLLTE